MRMAALNFGICDKEFIPSIYQVTIETLISNIGIDSNVLELRFSIALTLTLLWACFYLSQGIYWTLTPVMIYSRLSLNVHLYKMDTSVKQTPRVGLCLSLLILFNSL